MDSRPIVFRIHAIQRMFERCVSAENVRQILRSGEMIEDYSDDMPHPGGLVSGRRGNRPLHVVMAENKKEDELVVITVYEPDPAQWKAHFKSRKK
jgi:heme-degrading monooxygenase HmoA